MTAEAYGGEPEPAGRTRRGRALATTRRPGAVGTRQAAAPGLAQQRLMARISATRKARRQRTVIVACTLLSIAGPALVATGTWALTGYVSGHVARVSAGTAGAPSTGPLNILLAGVDRRTGLTRRQQLQLHVGPGRQQQLRHADGRCTWPRTTAACRWSACRGTPGWTSPATA